MWARLLQAGPPLPWTWSTVTQPWAAMSRQIPGQPLAPGTCSRSSRAMLQDGRGAHGVTVGRSREFTEGGVWPGHDSSPKHQLGHGASWGMLGHHASGGELVKLEAAGMCFRVLCLLRQNGPSSFTSQLTPSVEGESLIACLGPDNT